MVHHSSPEAGAFRIASGPSIASDATSNLQRHATDLRMTGAGLGSYTVADTSTPRSSGSSIDIPPITDVASRSGSDIYKTAAAPRQPLDGAKSIGDMVKSGAIADNTKAVEPVQRDKAEGGKAPTIKVQFSDITAANKVQPDFVVRQDGSIHMNNNPEKSGQKEIVVEVERQNGQLMPSEAQQKSIDDLYKFLDARVKAENTEAAQNGVKIDDPQDLVSKETEQATKARSQDQLRPEQFPQEAEEQTRRMNRFKGSGSGQMSRGEANDYFPERSTKRTPGETDTSAALKDVVAGFTSRGAEKPYEHVVHRGERGFGVGRYGMTYDNFANWLSGIDIENLEELERQGKIPKGTAAKMKAMKASMAKAKESGKDSDLDPFLQKLKAGDKSNPPTGAEINEMMPKEVQELVADHQIKQMATEMGQKNGNVNPGELALGMMIGKVPTAEDLQSPENKRFVDAANQSYQIALGRYENPNGPVKFADAGSMGEAMRDAVGKQLWRGYDSQTEYGNLGCAITVSRMLRAGGMEVGDILSVEGMKNKMRAIGAEKTSLQDAIDSGKPYVIIKQVGGSHTGMGIGRTVVENSSSAKRTVSRDISQSSLRSGSYAFILPSKG